MTPSPAMISIIAGAWRDRAGTMFDRAIRLITKGTHNADFNSPERRLMVSLTPF